MYSTSYLLIVTILLVRWTEAKLENNEVHQRTKRQLLYPNSTLLQFAVGIGTPTPASNVNMNFAIQANFQLPWNRTQIPVDILHANSGYDGESRKKRDKSSEELLIRNDNKMGYYENDARLYHYYQYVENVLNGFGYNGSSCVLRTLCHLGVEPLHSEDEEDLLHELAIFVLNPENDITQEVESTEVLKYVNAHKSGSSAEDCEKTYKTCSLSLIDMFSKLNDIS